MRGVNWCRYPWSVSCASPALQVHLWLRWRRVFLLRLGTQRGAPGQIYRGAEPTTLCPLVRDSVSLPRMRRSSTSSWLHILRWPLANGSVPLWALLGARRLRIRFWHRLSGRIFLVGSSVTFVFANLLATFLHTPLSCMYPISIPDTICNI